MSQQEVSPILLAEAQVEQAAELLARVFQHDPMMKYLVANDHAMLTKPLRLYQASIRMGLLYGEVYTTAAMDGLAVWISPGNTDFSFPQMLRSGLLSGVMLMGLKSLSRFMTSYSTIDKLTKQSISRPHWLLMFLGVEPKHHGKGLGGQLIAPILARADREGVPCYLESNNERNLTFYKRHGFEIVGQVQIPDGPPAWGMRREPGGAAVTN